MMKKKKAELKNAEFGRDFLATAINSVNVFLFLIEVGFRYLFVILRNELRNNAVKI